MPLAEQFRHFCTQNNISDPAKALELFAIFGGLDDAINPSKPLDTLIKEHVLEPYKQLHSLISSFTQSDPTYHKLLTGVAQGDGRAAFKRARIGATDGERALEAMREAGFLRTQSCFKNPNQERLSFTLPFFRFWFAFISPIFKGISQGDYTEFEQLFTNRKNEFNVRIFEQLFEEVILESIDEAMSIRAFWDSQLYIPIIVTCKDRSILAGSIKCSNQKMKKSELSALQTLTKEANIKADGYILISKNGFSNELKNTNESNLRLFTQKHLRLLMR
jgi:hypothetical protein